MDEEEDDECMTCGTGDGLFPVLWLDVQDVNDWTIEYLKTSKDPKVDMKTTKGPKVDMKTTKGPKVDIAPTLPPSLLVIMEEEDDECMTGEGLFPLLRLDVQTIQDDKDWTIEYLKTSNDLQQFVSVGNTTPMPPTIAVTCEQQDSAATKSDGSVTTSGPDSKKRGQSKSAQRPCLRVFPTLSRMWRILRKSFVILIRSQLWMMAILNDCFYRNVNKPALEQSMRK